jgi:Ca2+-binding RTX toxin-like protein
MSAHRKGLALVTLTFVGASLAPLGTAAAQAVPTCAGRTATIVGTSGADHLHGTPKADVIVGLGGDDRIRGGGGDDVMCGGDGDDRIFGGKGDDTMLGQTGTDVLDDEGGGVSVMKAGAGDDFLQTEAGDGGRFEGGPGNDTYFIVSDHAHLDGGPGDDSLELLSPFWSDESLTGGSGHDLLLFDLRRHSTSGPGYRVVTADLASGTITANHTSVPMTGFEDLFFSDESLNTHSTDPAVSRKYVLRGTAGPNQLIAGVIGHHAPPVRIFGRGGDDVLGGGSGPDLLDGGPGHDTGNARSGHDICHSLEVAHHCEVSN